MIIMTDIDISEVEVMEEDQGTSLFMTTKEDSTVLETIDQQEDLAVAGAIPTMTESNTETNLSQDVNPIQEHSPSPRVSHLVLKLLALQLCICIQRGLSGHEEAGSSHLSSG